MGAATKTVLVVEDFKDTGDILSAFLEGLGYDVVRAADGMEALSVCRREHPDVVLMDLDLPVLDGFTAAGLMRSNEELRGVPIIAMTAYHEAYPRAEAMSERCDEYLSKPLDLSALEDAIGRLLNKN